MAPADGWPSGGAWQSSPALYGITYGQGQYVAVGEYVGSDFGFSATSADGVHWTVSPFSMSDPLLCLYDVAYGNGVFVAGSWGAYIYHSTDGINWTGYETTSGNVNAVTFGGGQFVAVGDGHPLSGPTTTWDIYTSTDGANWTARNSGATTAPYLGDIAYGNGRYVAQDNQGYFYTSTTGTYWSRFSPGYPSSVSVSFAKDRFIALTYKGTNLVSYDGFIWQPMTKNVTNSFSRVLYQEPYYVALSGPGLFTSTDCANWTQRALTPPADTHLTDVVVGVSNLVVVGYTGYYQHTVPVAYASGPFVSLAMAGGAPGRLSVSGWSGRSCQVQYMDSLKAGSRSWQTLTTLTLSSTPILWTDTTATNSQRYYRAVLP